LAIGCSEKISSPAAQAKTSSFLKPLKVTISEISGSPKVSVFVLSKAIAFIFPISSKNFPPLINTPFFVAFPKAEKTVTGVDITSAQGQEIISKVKA